MTMELNKEQLQKLVQKLAQEWEQEKYALEQKILALQNENDSFHEQISPINRDIIAQYLIKIKEFELLSKNEIENELKAVKEDIKKQIASISTEDSRIKSIRDEIAKLDGLISCFLEEITKLRQEKDRLLQQKVKNEDLLAGRKKEINELGEQLHNSEKRKEELMLTKNETEKQLKTADEEVKRQEIDVAAGNETINLLNYKLSNLNKMIPGISEDINRLKAEKDRLLTGNNGKKIDINNKNIIFLKEQDIILERKLGELEITRNEISRELEMLRCELKKSETKYSDNENRIITLKNETETMENNVLDITEEIEKSKRKMNLLAMSKKKYEEVAVLTQDKLQDLKKQYNANRDVWEELSRQKSEIQENILSVENETRNMKEESKTYTDIQNHMLAEIVIDKQKIELLQAEIDKSMKTYATKRELAEKMEKECEKRGEEITGLKEEIKKCSVHQMENKLREIRQNNDSLENEYLKLRKKEINLHLERIGLGSELRERKINGMESR